MACGGSDDYEARYRAEFAATVAQDFIDGFGVQDLRSSEDLCIRDAMWESIGRSVMDDVPLTALEANGSKLHDRNVTSTELRAFTDRLSSADCLDWDDLYRRLPEVSALITFLDGTRDATTLDCYLTSLVGSPRWSDLLYEQYAANAQRRISQPDWVGDHLDSLAKSCGFDRSFLTRR